MSLFQLQDYWRTKLNEDDEYDCALAIGNADNQGGDKIIVGSLGGNLRIYEPKGNEYRGTHVVFIFSLRAPKATHLLINETNQ